MFELCTNAGCVFSCWCKRFTYNNKVQGNSPDFPRNFFNCNGEYYVMNKAREIYERDNPNDSIDEELERVKYKNNNRKSRMREDDNPDQRTGEGSQDDTSSQDSVLQLQRRSDRRSNNEGVELPELVQRYVNDWERYTGFTQRPTLLQNITFDGFSPTRVEPGRIDGSETAQRVWEISESTDIRMWFREESGAEDSAVLRRQDSSDTQRSETEQPNS